MGRLGLQASLTPPPTTPSHSAALLWVPIRKIFAAEETKIYFVIEEGVLG